MQWKQYSLEMEFLNHFKETLRLCFNHFKKIFFQPNKLLCCLSTDFSMSPTVTKYGDNHYLLKLPLCQAPLHVVYMSDVFSIFSFSRSFSSVFQLNLYNQKTLSPVKGLLILIKSIINFSLKDHAF